MVCFKKKRKEKKKCVNIKGTCVPLSGVDGQCLCPPGYSGRLCEYPQRTFCSQSPCRNGSTCIVLNHTGDGFCLCQDEYTGPFCEYITPTACKANCHHNAGKCALIDNKYGRCLCPKDVTGSFCDIPLHPCAPNPCGKSNSIRFFLLFFEELNCFVVQKIMVFVFMKHQVKLINVYVHMVIRDRIVLKI